MATAVSMMSDDEINAARETEEDKEAGFGALASERGMFPLRSVKVFAKLTGLCSHVTLDQTFLNAFDTPLEATYIFPLPPQAAVTSFRLEVKNRVVEGVIKERGEARQEYSQAVQTGHRAAIAEEERQGVFSIRVGNIGSGEIASVRLTMAAPLPFADGEATFRFPLLVAPRYIPGVGLSGMDVGGGVGKDTNETPDASRITPPQRVTLPGFPDPIHLGIEVEFDVTSLPVSNVRCSLHTVEVSDVSQTATSPTLAIRRLRLDPTGDCRLNRDFILRFNVVDNSALEKVTASLMMSDDADDESEEGTWHLTLVAPQGAGNAGGKTPRDVVFVVDRSGSMAGWKMLAARDAIAKMVNRLSDEDNFTVLAFDNSIESPLFTTGTPSSDQWGSSSFPQRSAFGQPASTSAFGQTSIFGKSPCLNAFGGTTQTRAFDQLAPTAATSGPPQTSPFGKTPSATTFGGPPQTGLVGQPPSTTTFGAPPQTGLFGQPPSTTTFGAPPHTSIFGQPLPPTATLQTSLFAHTPSTKAFGAPPHCGLFGQTSATPPQTSLFGGTPFTNAPITHPPLSLLSQLVVHSPPTNPGSNAANLVPASQNNRQRAATFLSNLTARGGTEMAAPLLAAADALRGLGVSAAPAEDSGGFWPARGVEDAPVRDRIMVLVTDGQVGNEDWILGQLAPKLQGVRIFTLGIDQSVNEAFLRRLAALSPGGACELVESQGRLRYAMDRIHRLICAPLLTDVQIDGPRGRGVEPLAHTVTPSSLPGLFPGVPVVVSGRYRKRGYGGSEMETRINGEEGQTGQVSKGSGQVSGSVDQTEGETGQVNGEVDCSESETGQVSRGSGQISGKPENTGEETGPVEESIYVTVTGKTAAGENGTEIVLAQQTLNPALRALWARARICDLDDQFAVAAAPRASQTPNPDELRARILETSLRFQVLSRFTAFVAVDRAEKVDGALTRVTQPVDAPAGWNFVSLSPSFSPPPASYGPPSAGLFGASQTPQGAPFGTFSGPCFGHPSPIFGGNHSSGFGASVTASREASTGFSNPSAFGPARKSTWGADSGEQNSPFGQKTSGTFGQGTGSAFGPTPAFGGGGALFGSTAAATWSGSAFGSPSPTFGSGTVTSGFGSTTAISGSARGSFFGATTPAFGWGNSHFGSTAASSGSGRSFFAATATGSVFGPPATTPTSSAFGSSAPTPNFGAPSSAPFGNPKLSGSPFGEPSPFTVLGNAPLPVQTSGSASVPAFGSSPFGSPAPGTHSASTGQTSGASPTGPNIFGASTGDDSGGSPFGGGFGFGGGSGGSLFEGAPLPSEDTESFSFEELRAAALAVKSGGSEVGGGSAAAAASAPQGFEAPVGTLADTVAVCLRTVRTLGTGGLSAAMVETVYEELVTHLKELVSRLDPGDQKRVLSGALCKVEASGPESKVDEFVLATLEYVLKRI
ncbi:poly (ADP-ribose) polymerase [Klebsormidium nitens]|uniref:Poly (ADP-ribose) polymerase n=1 Tax=Klebsormidium nitens TaxID=105231 RepID=A0A1Y1IWB4_KLENI|nr:poly (ADP-ribose) polymerase [Klebsormidium nitens]|eukprot:GAQ92568.1 poly (ADP-ribose) polymerase [Klebsormidium nitens]